MALEPVLVGVAHSSDHDPLRVCGPVRQRAWHRSRRIVGMAILFYSHKKTLWFFPEMDNRECIRVARVRILHMVLYNTE